MFACRLGLRQVAPQTVSRCSSLLRLHPKRSPFPPFAGSVSTHDRHDQGCESQHSQSHANQDQLYEEHPARLCLGRECIVIVTPSLSPSPLPCRSVFTLGLIDARSVWSSVSVVFTGTTCACFPRTFDIDITPSFTYTAAAAAAATKNKF